MSFKIRVEGIDDVTKALNSTKTTDAIRHEIHSSLSAIESTAKSLGSAKWLKRPQVSVPTINMGKTRNGGYVEINSRGGYFQELGSVNHPPKPALGPAVDRHIPSLMQRINRIAGDL